jgi:hypothetical protein
LAKVNAVRFDAAHRRLLSVQIIKERTLRCRVWAL